MSDESGRGAEQAVWTPSMEQLLQEWRSRVYAAQAAYYEMAERLRRRNYVLGIPVVIVSSMVGTAVFADWDKDSHYKWVVGGVSIAAAVLSSLQTFLKFGENASLHGSAADWFSAIRRDIEELLALPADVRGNPKQKLDAIRQEINRAAQKSPELSERLWKTVAGRFGVDEPPLKGRQTLPGWDGGRPGQAPAPRPRRSAKRKTS